MNLGSRRASALVVTLAGCSAGMFGAAGAAHAATAQPNTVLSTVLPFSNVADTIVDTETGYIFVSGNSTYVEVLSLSGRVVGQISNQQGASGMAMSADGSTLYIADTGSDSISVINASTLAQVTSYSTPNLSPEYVAQAGGELWFTTASTLDVQEVDLATGTVSATTASTEYYGAALEASPYAPNTLVTGTYGSEPSTIYVYTVESGALTLTTGDSGQLNSSRECANLKGMAITPDGASLVVSCGSANSGLEVSLAGLDNERAYDTGGDFTDSAAVSSDGKVLIGQDSGTNNPPPPVDEFDLNSSTAIGDYGVVTGPDDVLLSVPFVGWGANDSVFYSVVDGYGASPTLETIVLNSTMTLNAPTMAHPGTSYTVSGSVTDLAGAEVAVTRTADGTTTTLGPYITDASGAFSFSDSVAEAGTTATYTASVVGASTLTATTSLPIIPGAYPVATPPHGGVLKTTGKVTAGSKIVTTSSTSSAKSASHNSAGPTHGSDSSATTTSTLAKQGLLTKLAAPVGSLAGTASK
jgi:YVTN family beta-propeller protein